MKKRTDRFFQFITLLTCFAVMAVGASVRDGRFWGHEWGLKDTATVTTNIRTDTIRVLGNDHFVVNTTSLGRDIKGFGGQVPLEIELKNGKVAGVNALKNSESPEFFCKASQLLNRWNGCTPAEGLALKVDAVSGATYSSKAIIANMRVGLSYADKNTVKRSWINEVDSSAKSLLTLLVVLMGAILPLFYKNKHYRMVQLLLNVVVLGFWGGTFISYSLMIGFLSSGIDIGVSLVPIVMLITAFIYPLFGKKNYYCTYICPCGSTQDLVGRLNRKKWRLSPRLTRRLSLFRRILWYVLMVLMVTGTWTAWMNDEIFSAFIIHTASWVVLIMAAVVLVLAVFIPRPYCRFVCPTGTLFKMAQHSK